MTNKYQWLEDAQETMNNAEVPRENRAVYDPLSGRFIFNADTNVSVIYSTYDNSFIGVCVNSFD